MGGREKYNFMSHEIESDYKENWYNKKTQCQNCTSFIMGEDGKYYCSEGKCEVPPDAHCDFFQAID